MVIGPLRSRRRHGPAQLSPQPERTRLRAIADGKLAAIAPGGALPALAAALPEAVTGGGPDVLDAPVAAQSVAEAEGLEFGRVVLAGPAGILAQSPKGDHDLYVALTRVTRRLTVVYGGANYPSSCAG